MKIAMKINTIFKLPDDGPRQRSNLLSCFFFMTLTKAFLLMVLFFLLVFIVCFFSNIVLKKWHSFHFTVCVTLKGTKHMKAKTLNMNALICPHILFKNHLEFKTIGMDFFFFFSFFFTFLFGICTSQARDFKGIDTI
jgi:hypothetical protein